MTGSSTVERLAADGSATAGTGPVELLAVAADLVRWQVLERLTYGTACVCDLQAETGVAPNLLSYHLKVLRDAGLVTATRRGRWIDYRLADGALDRLVEALPGGGGVRR